MHSMSNRVPRQSHHLGAALLLPLAQVLREQLPPLQQYALHQAERLGRDSSSLQERRAAITALGARTRPHTNTQGTEWVLCACVLCVYVLLLTGSCPVHLRAARHWVSCRWLHHDSDAPARPCRIP